MYVNCTFAKVERKIKEIPDMEATLLRFVMFMDTKGFEVCDTTGVVCVPFKFLVFRGQKK